MSLAIVSAVLGEYDDYKDLPMLAGVDDAVLVVDRHIEDPPSGWRLVRWDQRWLSRREAAKLPKCRPDLFTWCDTSLWLDGSQQVTNGDFTTITDLLGDNDIAVNPHELRTCVYHECAHSIPHPYYTGQPVREQVERYWKLGMPKDWGLWETAFILRRHSSHMRLFGSLWLDEQKEWCLQDQLSLPWLLWSTNTGITTLPWTQYETPWTKFIGHKRSNT